jgi:hypothetical protein
MDIIKLKLAGYNLTDAEIETFLTLKTWSARIRFLVAKNIPDNIIAKILNKRQQHVRSVREKPRTPRETF